MKKWIFIMSSLFLVACGGGGGGDNNNANTGTVATTGLTTGCLVGQASCNNGIYGQYGQYGWQTYPIPYNSNWIQNSYYQGNYNFCGCPSGTQPTYNGTIGLGCVNTSMVPQAAFQWNLGMNFSWSYQRGFRSGVRRHLRRDVVPGFDGGNNCYSALAQSCYINQPGTCANGGACLATSAGSPLGLCASPQVGYGQPGYNQPGYNRPGYNNQYQSYGQNTGPLNTGGGSIR